MSNNDATRIDPVSSAEIERLLPGQTASIPPVTETSPLRELVAVLWKGRFVAAGIFALCVLCAVLYVVLTKPTYQGVASLEIDPNRPSSLGLGDLVTDKLSGDESSRLETEVQILQSDTVTLRAVLSLDDRYHDLISDKGRLSLADPSKLSPQDREWLIKLVGAGRKVMVVPNTDIIQISYVSREARYSADMVNAILDAYVEHDFKSRYESANQVSEWLSKQMEEIRVRAQGAQQRLADFAQKNNILGANENDNIITEKLRQINDQLTMAEADRIVKEARLKVARSGDPQLLASVGSNTTLQLLLAQQAQLQSDVSALSAKFGGNFPKLKELREQQSRVQANIAAENTNVEKRIEDDYLASKKTEEMLRANFEQQKNKAFDLNQNASQYAILKHEVLSSQDLYDTLQLKLKEAGVTAGLNSDVSIIDRASPPIKPAAPRPVFTIFLGVLVGTLGGLAGAFAVESLDDTVMGTDETEALSQLPVLTAIPEFKFIKSLRRVSSNGTSSNGNGSDRSAVETLISPNSLVAEGYRTLHNSIVFSSVDRPPQLLVFTSALPQDGKSTTCLNYATVLAQKGARVLLVDADLRRPSLGRRLGVSGAEGLGSVLLQQRSPDFSLQPISQLPNFHFLPGGPVPTAPADALASKRMKDIMKMWSDQYDHVIIDTPPVLSVSDSLALAREVDGTILVVRAGRTPKKAMLRSRDLLLRTQSRILGVVLNAVDMGVGGSYYNYSNSYGYGYSYGEESHN